MLPSELWRCIFVAWVVAVGWFRGVMLHQQNNEGPSSSDNFSPASPNPANRQHNLIQADGADDCKVEQNPILRGVQPNIPQDNDIKATACKKCNIHQMPIIDNVPRGTPWELICYGILIALTKPETLWVLLCCAILIALVVGLFWRKIASVLGLPIAPVVGLPIASGLPNIQHTKQN